MLKFKATYLRCCLAIALAGVASSSHGAFPWHAPLPEVGSKEIISFNGPGQSADYARKVVVSGSGRVYLLIRSLNVGVESSLVIHCFNPDGSLRWSDEREENGFEARELLVDAQDNAYVIGDVFNDSGFPDSRDVALFKYNPEGESVREHVYTLDYVEPLINPFYSENSATAAAFAPNGNIIITGFVSNRPFGEPSDVSHPVMFAINPSGQMNLIWTSDIHTAAEFGTVLEEVPVAIAMNQSNDVYEVSNFGTGIKSVHLRKVNAQGENVWSDSVKIPAFQGEEHKAMALSVDSSGNPYIAGTVEMDGVLKTFAARFDPADGEVVWLKTFDFGFTTEVIAATINSQDRFVLTGQNDSHWYVMVLNNAGQIVWKHEVGFGQARSLSLDRNDNIYVAVTGNGFPPNTAVAKFSADGQLIWQKEISNTQELPQANTMVATVAPNPDGSVYMAAHRNVGESNPVDGRAYPIYDAILAKLTQATEAPLVRFLSPQSTNIIEQGAPFPAISVEASSSVGIQKVAIYDRWGGLRAVLTNAPYTINLDVTDDLLLTPLYAVAYDSSGTAGVAVTSPLMGSSSSVIHFESAEVRVAEGAGIVRLIAIRNSIHGEATVEALLQPVTATMPGDFSYSGQETRVYFYFADGETFAEAEITIEDDELNEGDETFTATLQSPTGATIGDRNRVTVVIHDDDSGGDNKHGELAFDAWNYRVSESGGAVTVKIVRTQGSEGAVMVDYFTQPNTTVGGEDYLETRGRLVFAPGEIEKTITVHALQDAKEEAAESFYLTLYAPSGGASIGAKSFTLVYIDNSETAAPEPSISFDAAQVTMPEDGGNLLLVVRRSGDLAQGSSVNYTLSSGTAFHGVDFGGLISGTIQYAPQESVKSINIPVVADNQNEGNEHFFVQLSSPQSAKLGLHSLVRVDIVDAVTQGTSLTAWKNTFFTAEELANPAITGDMADPDGDKLPNILEYAVGQDPKAPVNSKLFEPQFTIRDGVPALEISFTRPKGRNDVDFIFNVFGALGGEQCSSCVDVTITDNGDGTERISVVATPVALQALGSLFIQVALEKN